MKNLFLLIGVLLSQNLFSQKTEENKFDAKDSIYTFMTPTHTVGTRLIAVSGDLKELRACAVYSRSLSRNYTASPDSAFQPAVCFFFSPDRVATITGGVSSVKVKFTDGQVVEYKYEGSNKLIPTNQSATIYFTVFATDKIFTTPIRSINISVSSGDMEYEINKDKRDFIKNSLQLLYQQTKQLR